MKKLILIEGFCTYDKFSYPKYVARLFLYYKEEGIQELATLFFNDIRPKHATAILGTLYYASQKKYFNPGITRFNSGRLKEPEITDNMAIIANRELFDIISKSLEDTDLFFYVNNFFFTECNSRAIEDANVIQKYFLNIIRDCSIQINSMIIEEFEKLIDNLSLNEEVYQKYLQQNPVILDPLAKEVVPKHKLGDDYITDFVIKKLNDEYFVVEIEKPSDNIFTRNDDFTAVFTHALGQVLDFQEWVESNLSYARTKLPNIISPKGLLIIGRDDSLNPQNRAKLERFNITMNGRIKVLTYNDVLRNAKTLYNNIIN